MFINISNKSNNSGDIDITLNKLNCLIMQD